MTKLWAAAAVCFALSGCSTMMETVTPGDSSSGYVKKKNKDGQTVYRRVRKIEPVHEEPIEIGYIEHEADEGEAINVAPPPPPPSAPPQPPAQVNPVPVGVPPAGSASSGAAVGIASPAAPGGVTTAPPLPPPQPRSWQPEPEPAITDPGHGFALGGELGADGKHMHLALDVYKEFADFIEGKIGVALFKGDTDLYAGFDIGIRPKIKFGSEKQFAVFAGVGGYGGDSKACSTDVDEDGEGTETCDKKFLFAGYVEGGVYFHDLSVFVRSYNINEADKQIPSNTFFGIGFHTSY